MSNEVENLLIQGYHDTKIIASGFELCTLAPMWCQKRLRVSTDKLYHQKAKEQAQKLRLFRHIHDEEVGWAKNELVLIVAAAGCCLSYLLSCNHAQRSRQR